MFKCQGTAHLPGVWRKKERKRAGNLSSLKKKPVLILTVGFSPVFMKGRNGDKLTDVVALVAPVPLERKNASKVPSQKQHEKQCVARRKNVKKGVAMGFLEMVSRCVGGLSDPGDKGVLPNEGDLLPCSVWLAAHDVGDLGSKVGFLEDLQRKMDMGMVPGTFVDAVGDVDSMLGTELDIIGGIRLGFLPDKARGLPVPFPVWLALSFGGLDEACDLQTRLGSGRSTVKMAFALFAKRDAGALAAWLPFLKGSALAMTEEALALSAADELRGCVENPGCRGGIDSPRAV